MENKTFLSAMLYFHKLVFKEQYDPFMVLAHVCLLKEKFIVSNVAEEVRILYVFCFLISFIFRLKKYYHWINVHLKI